MEIKYQKETNKSFGEAVESITKSLAEHQFGVLWKLNFKDKLAEKGLSFDKNFMIMEVCNPSKAKIVLEKHIDLGYFLPCKVVVFEVEGKTYIGFINPNQLIGMLGYTDLDDEVIEVESILKQSVDQAV